jgi:dTDP-4-amino-4,6-dideoxy-D-galactose acyltransferase
VPLKNSTLILGTFMTDKYEFLEWDSKFFGFGVARINNCLDFKDLTEIVKLCNNSGIKLLYYLSSQEQDIFRLNKLCRTPRLVDKKVLYCKKTFLPKEIDQNIVFEYTGKIPTKDMYALALESGIHSRFKIDPDIPAGKFEELYSLWIENSVNKIIAEKVFYTRDFEKISGMVTLEKKGNSATIGLLSVGEDYRGQKLGGKLIAYCENYCNGNGIQALYVCTQKDNIPACKFYESCGFEISNMDYVYHLWI